MKHEAGLDKLNQVVVGKDTKNLKNNGVGKIIEDDWSEGTPGRRYHSMTRDWITNEIFRRVEPSGRTMGEYLRSEKLTKEGRIIIGLQKEDMPSYFKMLWKPILADIGNLCMPYNHGRCSYFNLITIVPQIFRLLKNAYCLKKASKKKYGVFDIKCDRGTGEDMFYTLDFLEGETPSSNGHANARGLAYLAAVMANKGKLGRHQVMSEKTWEIMHSDATVEFEPYLENHTTFNTGGLHVYSEKLLKSEIKGNLPDIDIAFHRLSEGYVGWMGIGGSSMQWNVEHKLGFAYIPTNLSKFDFSNHRAARIQKICV